MFQDTTATRKIFELRKRIRAVSGGTAASKTISILIWCIDYAQTHENKLISVVSEAFPHLSGGAMLDFENIMKAHGYFEDKRWVKHPKAVYSFASGSKIEFISVDTYGKAHGPRRDVLFVNECNNLAYNIVDQLITRTREIVWLDWNPISEFWFYTEMQGVRDDVDHLKLTYLDNEALDENTVKEIESHKHKKGWWTVYGLGELGEIEERIYKGWKQLDEIPPEARLERRYVDFGYTNDPTAIGDIYYWNGAYVIDEIVYQRGLSNKKIAELLMLQEQKVLTVADSAEPKSIDEIRSFGINITGSKKGRDSVIHGIQNVQDQTIFITKRSYTIWKEYMNYVFLKDKDDRVLNQEDPKSENHHMAGIRYGMNSIIPILRRREMRSTLSQPPRSKSNIAV